MLLIKFNNTMKEPINALTHFIGAILSAFAIVSMVLRAISLENPSYILGATIFGSSLVLLYSASTIYHWVKGEKKIQDILRRVDHTMIYILIAGTYTPLCLSVLKGGIGIGLLIGVWVLAIIGIIITIVWLQAPRWVYTGFYLLLGWIGVIFIWPIFNAFELGGFITFILGGVFYTLGAIIYAKKIGILNFKSFGFHEIFHLFILAGSLFHFIMVNSFIII